MAFEGLTGKLNSIFSKLKQRGKLSEKDVQAVMREIRLALLEADVNYKVAKEFVASVSERAVGAEVMESLTPAQQVIKIVNDELTQLMGGTVTELKLEPKGTNVIMMCGLQGSGKTTHSVKIAKYYKEHGRRPMIAACDVYRPAAIDQLKILGQQAEIYVFDEGQGDPVMIAKHAYDYARDHGYDILFLDTAGRLHVDEQLMEELQNIKKTINVGSSLLVVDSMTGQDAVNVASSFSEQIGIDGVVLTKLDGDARGGAALSVLKVTGKPILFAGTGEKIGDIEQFHPDRMASRILGMGDVLSFIEKAQTQFDEKEAEELSKKIKKGMDMNDLLDQMHKLEKMGGIKEVARMMPGGAQIKEEDLDDSLLKKTEAIIYSMTPAERAKPSIIDPKRKRRIAAGSGTKVEDVNRLLRQFEQSNKMIKQMQKKGKRRRGFFNPGFGGNQFGMMN
ncbi:MAG: signal recognition particle protein [Oscillospiraceae bacterium]|nr:signal recognition particle protein [Oscillospiraceae bacterium]MBR2805592.1 signal recognition particle protein [Oscillospiraceae bacterium]